MISSQEELQKLSDKAAAHVLSMEGTQSGTRTGWLMITTILIEAWDLYSISFLLVFIKNEFKPDSALLGLASASVQLGALLGAVIGGAGQPIVSDAGWCSLPPWRCSSFWR
jgi:hypothetical protein